jgi:hypothetical protein
MDEETPSRGALAQELPDHPLTADTDTIDLEQFEVVVAYNLDPPYRYSQEYFWLEVLAADEKTAIQTAIDWVVDAGENFESTAFLRHSTPHHNSLGRNHRGEPLEIAWNLPVHDQMPPNAMVRDPVSGLRIGFIASPEVEAVWVPKEAQDRYRLIVRKPVRGADPVCLAPLVHVAQGRSYQPLALEGEEL